MFRSGSEKVDDRSGGASFSFQELTMLGILVEDLHERNDELEGEGRNGAHVEPERHEEGAHDAVEGIHGQLSEPLALRQLDLRGLGDESGGSFLEQLHAVDPCDGITRLEGVSLIAVGGTPRGRHLDPEQSYSIQFIRLLDQFLARFSLRDILVEEVLGEVADDLEREEVLDCVENTASLSDHKVADNGNESVDDNLCEAGSVGQSPTPAGELPLMIHCILHLVHA